jgi:carbon monoxide dehydrogenase subunit G
MKLGSTFTVPVDSERVFERFLDPDSMRVCIPGCEELLRVDDKHYTGRLVNEIAHVRFNASFSAEITELTPPRKVRAVLKGEDRRLGSSLKLDAVLTVQPAGDASEVTYSMEMALWGKLGRMGESILRRRTAEVETQFVERFTQVCTGVPLEEVAAGGKARIKPAPSAATAPAAPAAEATAVRPATAAPAALEAPGEARVPLQTAALAGLALAVLGWLLGRCGARSAR